MKSKKVFMPKQKLFRTMWKSMQIDEAPVAYCSITEIAEQTKDTVEITEILNSAYNFKAGNRK